MPFKKVDRKPVFTRLEEQILSLWRENRLFEKTVERGRDREPFVFYEGPPTANGLPHAGHVLGRALKDVFLRHRMMSGFNVLRKAGWDTHGLPVELEVERELGLNGKDQIEKYGVAEFVQKCRESVFRYENEWRRMTERVGFWVDMDAPYITCTNDYIESVWWILKQFYNEGLLYRGHKIVPYCPRCETALSSHEVAQGYEEVDDPSVFIRCPLVDEPGTSFLVWTTTPWTLISNVALAVGENIEYVKVKYVGRGLPTAPKKHGENSNTKSQLKDEIFILAEARVKAVFGDEPIEILETFPGSKLKDIRYTPPFTFCRSDKKGHYVITADFVSTEDGTGIVHIAPAFGEDDYRVGEQYDLPFFQPVSPQGLFADEVTDWKGLFVKDADPLIIKDLESRGILMRAETYRHSYPFCWRCDSPLLYYARASWFLKTTAFRDDLLRINEEINWIPDHIKRGRMGDFLENNVDWAISRERYWGTPLNLWICEKCSQMLCIGSLEELLTHAVNFPEDELDLHKPYIDEIQCCCIKCSGTMKRVPEVIDCWFDSGAMPVAQWHYPHENKEIFEKTFPADFITEAVDQTRGWFYSLMVISAFLFKKSSFSNCLVQGHILDKDGQKMSKSRGNMIDPWIAFDRFGADAFRWFLYRENNPWIPTRFSTDAVMEVQKNFFLTLWNVYSFFVIYANIDEFDPAEHTVPMAERALIDRWILSSFNNLIKTVDANLKNYQVTPAARAAEGFVDDLSNWYVRRCRNRFWKAEKDTDKWAAYTTLYEVLTTLARLLAPLAPFITEEIYRNLVNSSQSAKCKVQSAKRITESVHLTAFPIADEAAIDEELENAMARIRQIVNEGRSLRTRAGIRIRQPVTSVFIKMPEGKQRKFIEPLLSLIQDELNVREIHFRESFDELLTVKINPNFRQLGPRFGKDVQTIISYLKNSDPEPIVAALKKDHSAQIEIDGRTFLIEEEDVEMERRAAEGYEIGELVAIDVRITDGLRRAGIAREIIHRIQNIRKELDLEYTDRIVIEAAADEDLISVINEFEDYIKNETLAVEIRRGKACLAPTTKPDEGHKFNIDGIPLWVNIKKS
ncbi:MAG: isoleucine--tRNA ligase [bacterium]